MRFGFQQKEVSLFACSVWGLAAFFFFVQYIARVMPSVAAFHLMRDFSASAFAIGGLSATFYYAYAAMQLPVGLLFDRYGVRLLLVYSALISGLGCFLLAGAHSLGMAQLSRFIMGFGGAFAFIGAIKLANIWFPEKWMGIVIGLTQGLGLLGVVVGGAPAAALIGEIGWRHFIFLLGAIFLLIGLIIWTFVRKRKKNVMEKWFGSDPTSKFIDSIKVVMRSRQTWLLGLVIAMTYAPTAAFGEFWGPSFFERVYGLSMSISSGINSMIFFGWMVGAPLVGWWSDRVGKRKPFIFGSTVLSLIFFILMVYVHVPHISELYLIAFLYGLANTGLVVVLAVSSEIHSVKVSGTAIAFANMSTIFIGMFMQPLVGLLLDVFWRGELVQHVPYYSPLTFRISMSFLAICFVIGVIATFWIKETFCRRAP